jgi:hypothetical protein
VNFDSLNFIMYKEYKISKDQQAKERTRGGGLSIDYFFPLLLSQLQMAYGR